MKLQIFLSSKMQRNVLQPERIVARKAIEAIEIWTCWHWEEHATSGSFPPMDLCLDEVKRSDALVLILGRDLTENTRQEYEMAASLPIRRYVFVKSGNLQPHTRQFLKDIQSEVTYQKFANVGELETMIKKSLQDDLVRGYRALRGYPAIGLPGAMPPVASYPKKAV
ncbi:MAG: DUF4062 domain-containing protein [Rubrobacteraceae bacterium]